MMKKYWWITLVLCAGLGPACAEDGAPMPQADRQAAEAHFAGWPGWQSGGAMALPPALAKTAGELAAFSGRAYRVLPVSAQAWDQAHGAGWILLDLEPGAAKESVLAFRLAHEWAHEALGHPASFRKQARGWLYSAGTAAAEREADGYAGRFLARYGYPHSKVVRFLHDEQDGQRGGPERARRFAEAYAAEQAAREAPSATGMTIAQCIRQEYPRRCIETCVSHFGNPREQCVSRFCLPTQTNLAGWRDRCVDIVAGDD